MGFYRGPNIVRDGLSTVLDAASTRSYPGTGTSWTDLGSLKRTGTLTNGPTFSSEYGGAIIFDGDNDRVELSSSTFTPYSFNFWLYNNNIIPNSDSAIGGPSTYQTLFSFSGATAGVNLGGWTSSATNEAIHIWSVAGGNAGITYTKDSVAVGVHNFVFNWNGTYYDIWVDGVKSTVYAGSGGHALLVPYTNVTSYLCTDNVTYEFYGKIYTFHMYSRSLTDSEVTQNYNAMKTRFGK